MSPAEIAQAVHILADTVPTSDNRRGMYFTDLVSMTVFTTVSGAAYMIMFEMTAKNPKNFEGDEEIKDTKSATPVIAEG